MKKIMIIGILFGLCGNGMGAEHGADYFESRGVQLKMVRLTPELKAIFNLNQGDEDGEKQSENEVISLKSQLIEEKTLSNYYTHSVHDFYADCKPAFGAAMCAFLFKIASYFYAFSTCNGIRGQGGTCSMDPCDPQVRLNLLNSGPNTCVMTYFANFAAYISVIIFVAVTGNLLDKFNSAPR